MRKITPRYLYMHTDRYACCAFTCDIHTHVHVHVSVHLHRHVNVQVQLHTYLCIPVPIHLHGFIDTYICEFAYACT